MHFPYGHAMGHNNMHVPMRAQVRARWWSRDRAAGAGARRAADARAHAIVRLRARAAHVHFLPGRPIRRVFTSAYASRDHVQVHDARSVHVHALRDQGAVRQMLSPMRALCDICIHLPVLDKYISQLPPPQVLMATGGGGVRGTALSLSGGGGGSGDGGLHIRIGGWSGIGAGSPGSGAGLTCVSRGHGGMRNRIGRRWGNALPYRRAVGSA